MKSLFQILWLELTAIWRSGTMAILTAVSVGWMLVFPYVVKGDGTAEGAREMYLRYSLGGVFALLVICLLAAATGTLAKERAAKRLQLTMVRPVRYGVIAFGKMVAYVLTGALILAVSALILAFRVDTSMGCNHVLSPVLSSPQEEAKQMYDEYMKDPATPEPIKKAKKAVVLRILTQRALDHYQTIPTNGVVSWTFRLPVPMSASDALKARMRFTNQYDMRQDVVGEFRFGGLTGPVSNITQAVLTVPLVGSGKGESIAAGETELTFANAGKHPLMLRSRKDINLLIPADGFIPNLVRAYLDMVAVLAFIIAFGTFLSASLGRPVALFVAIVTLIVSEMSPSVIEQYPDVLETNRLDRIGLMFSRVAAEVTHPISELSPLESLAKDECVEFRDVSRALVLDMVAIPLLLAFLSALVMPRKQDDL